MVTELSVSINFKDPSKPHPVDFFPSSSENLAYTVPGESFSFTRPVCGFPGATDLHTQDIWFVYVWTEAKIAICQKVATW